MAHKSPASIRWLLAQQGNDTKSILATRRAVRQSYAERTDSHWPDGQPRASDGAESAGQRHSRLDHKNLGAPILRTRKATQVNTFVDKHRLVAPNMPIVDKTRCEIIPYPARVAQTRHGWYNLDAE